MKEKHNLYHLLGVTIIAGMSVFSMFFGSGNLVFPLAVGMSNGDHFLLSTLGLVVTGVIVPFLGLYGMIIYDGDKEKYFSTVHPYLPKIISALILALLGPFGVVPRCIIVAYGGVSLAFPDISLWLFSSIFCLLMFSMIGTKKRIIEVIGKYLTPILLLGVAAIIIFGVFGLSTPVFNSNRDVQSVFLGSILAGYNTMDLLAAFFFGITIKHYLNNVLKNHTDARYNHLCSLGTCVIAALLLAIVYAGFVWIGRKYSADLKTLTPESYLAHIADLTLGGYAKYIAAGTIALACFTTAVILTRLFADFIDEAVPQNMSGKIFNSKVITLVTSFALSLVGFKKITMFLGGILSFLYPALIAIALGNILEKKFNITVSAKLFWFAIASQAVMFFYG